MPRGEADYRESAAARMLAEGLRSIAAEERTSQRALAKRLGYKQAVVLSHMALGRVPIPVERAAQLAENLHLDQRSFLLAVLEQRHPQIGWRKAFSSSESSTDHPQGLSAEIEVIAGRPLDDLSREQQYVMREVAADPAPRRRWLSVHEIPAVMKMRSAASSDDETGPPALF